jgi:hypothetical protein
MCGIAKAWHNDVVRHNPDYTYSYCCRINEPTVLAIQAVFGLLSFIDTLMDRRNKQLGVSIGDPAWQNRITKSVPDYLQIAAADLEHAAALRVEPRSGARPMNPPATHDLLAAGPFASAPTGSHSSLDSTDHTASPPTTAETYADRDAQIIAQRSLIQSCEGIQMACTTMLEMPQMKHCSPSVMYTAIEMMGTRAKELETKLGTTSGKVLNEHREFWNIAIPQLQITNQRMQDLTGRLPELVCKDKHKSETINSELDNCLQLAYISEQEIKAVSQYISAHKVYHIRLEGLDGWRQRPDYLTRRTIIRGVMIYEEIMKWRQVNCIGNQKWHFPNRTKKFPINLHLEIATADLEHTVAPPRTAPKAHLLIRPSSSAPNPSATCSSTFTGASDPSVSYDSPAATAPIPHQPSRATHPVASAPTGLSGSHSSHAASAPVPTHHHAARPSATAPVLHPSTPFPSSE